MRPVAAQMLECKPKEVRFGGGCVYRNGSAIGNGISFRDVAAKCILEHICLSRHGFFDSPPTSWDPKTGHGAPYVTYAYATQIAEVEVDTETYEVNVKKIWASHDVGKAINPNLVRGQIEGGVLQGMAYALMEYLKVDDNGRILNNAFSTYILPSIGDMPEIIPHIVESRWPEGPYGAKGFAETPLMGVAAAIGNAISHALDGLDVNEVPILPEVLFEMKENK
jgi:CO/xanthine dehydrogenase Mo-binding subunit